MAFGRRSGDPVQVLLRRFTTSDYQLDVPVAFVKDSLTDEVSVRVGRLPLPLFMISDYRTVGFANTFIRPPTEVYGAAPLYTINGADVLYSHSFGPIEVNSQLYYGGSTLNLESATVTARKEFGGNPVPAWVDLTDGSVAPDAGSTGFQAIAQLARGFGQPEPPPLPSIGDNDDYYAASLTLLATIAKREMPR